MTSSDARFATCMALAVTLHDGVHAALQLGRGLLLAMTPTPASHHTSRTSIYPFHSLPLVGQHIPTQGFRSSG